MGTFTVTVDGVPFRASGSSIETAQQAKDRIESFKRANPEQFEQRKKERIAELKSIGVELNEGDPTAGMGAGEKFAVGAGRTFTEIGRGLAQRGAEAAKAVGDFAGRDTSGIDAFLQESRTKEAGERELFAILDDQGFGAEDLGQIAPELVAFIGSGGVGSLALRGAALGGAKATTEEGEAGTNALLGGLAGAVGGAAAKALSRFIKPNAKVSSDVMKAARELVAGGGNIFKRMATVLRQGELAKAVSDDAVRQIGAKSLSMVKPIVQSLNQRGKDGLMREYVLRVFNESMKNIPGKGGFLDVGKFTNSLASFNRTALRKELGKTAGDRLNNVRNLFEKVQNIRDLPDAEVSNILRAMFDDSTAQALARQLGKQPTPQGFNLFREYVGRWTERSAAAAAESTVNQ